MQPRPANYLIRTDRFSLLNFDPSKRTGAQKVNRETDADAGMRSYKCEARLACIYQVF